MKLTIKSLGGKLLHEYKDALIDKGIDYESHVYTPNQEHPDYQVLKDIEVSSIEELFAIFENFEGFSYPNCQIAVDVKNRVINIFDTWVE